MRPKRKGKVRWGALTSAATTLGGIAWTIVSHPDVIQTLAAKVGVSAAVAGVVAQAITKAVVRKEYER